MELMIQIQFVECEMMKLHAADMTSCSFKKIITDIWMNLTNRTHIPLVTIVENGPDLAYVSRKLFVSLVESWKYKFTFKAKIEF
jgi:hypothetical protein